MINFIQGEKFVSLSNQIYSIVNLGTDYNLYENSFNIDTLNDNDIVYTNTHYVDNLIKLLERIPKQIILVTHNSDRNIVIEPPQKYY